MTEKTGWLDGRFLKTVEIAKAAANTPEDYASRGGATEFSASRKNPARWWHSQSKESAPLEKIGELTSSRANGAWADNASVGRRA